MKSGKWYIYSRYHQFRGQTMADHPVNDPTPSHICMKSGVCVYHEWEGNYINHHLFSFIRFQDLVWQLFSLFPTSLTVNISVMISHII